MLKVAWHILVLCVFGCDAFDCLLEQFCLEYSFKISVHQSSLLDAAALARAVCAAATFLSRKGNRISSLLEVFLPYHTRSLQHNRNLCSF